VKGGASISSILTEESTKPVVSRARLEKTQAEKCLLEKGSSGAICFEDVQSEEKVLCSNYLTIRFDQLENNRITWHKSIMEPSIGLKIAHLS